MIAFRVGSKLYTHHDNKVKMIYDGSHGDPDWFVFFPHHFSYQIAMLIDKILYYGFQMLASENTWLSCELQGDEAPFDCMLHMCNLRYTLFLVHPDLSIISVQIVDGKLIQSSHQYDKIYTGRYERCPQKHNENSIRVKLIDWSGDESENQFPTIIPCVHYPEVLDRMRPMLKIVLQTLFAAMDMLKFNNNVINPVTLNKEHTLTVFKNNQFTKITHTIEGVDNFYSLLNQELYILIENKIYHYTVEDGTLIDEKLIFSSEEDIIFPIESFHDIPMKRILSAKSTIV